MRAYLKRSPQTPTEKAARTARWAATMTRWRIAFVTGGKQYGSRRVRPTRRWQLVAFPGASGAESRGIVDLLAIRKDHRLVAAAPFNRGDLFEIILIQIKGGSAAYPTNTDLERLCALKARYRAKAVLLAAWKRGRQPQFYRLRNGKVLSPRSANWEAVDPGDVFK